MKYLIKVYAGKRNIMNFGNVPEHALRDMIVIWADPTKDQHCVVIPEVECEKKG